MFNPFRPPELIKAEVFMSMPRKFRKKRRTAWSDGIEMDAENGLCVRHLGVGVWRFDSNMLPTHLVYSDDPHHHHLGNIAFGGPDRKTLYITEELSGDILIARMPVAGKKLYAHR